MFIRLWELLKNNAPTAAIILLVLSFIVEITPIKINPWASLFKKIGKLLANETYNKLSELVKKVDYIEINVIENEKDRIRWEILDFANSCRNGRLHTRDEFQHIIALESKYRKLLKQTNDSNGVFEIEFNYIKDLYAERLQKNDFLK